MQNELKVAHVGEEPQRTNNIVLDVKHFLNHNYNLRRNLISRNIELDGVPIDDTILNSIFINVKTNYGKASKDLVKIILFSDFVKTYNPCFDLYEANKFMPTKNEIQKLWQTIETDSDYYGTWIKKWYVGIIASIHGHHSPLALVLTGGINKGKTEWFRRLLPKEILSLYTEEKLKDDKDAFILMTKKLIIMDDEWGSMTKKEEKFFRALMSKQIFPIREPFGHISVDLVRLCVFCGTCNDMEIVTDADNNRRILPVNVINIKFKEYNEINKIALFVEAWKEYINGYNYRLTPEEIELLYHSSEKHKVIDAEEELLNSRYGKPEDLGVFESDPLNNKKWTNTEILAHLKSTTGLVLQPKKLGSALKSAGFQQISEKRNGKAARLYLLYLKSSL